MMQPSSSEWPSTDRFSAALRRSTSVAPPKSVPDLLEELAHVGALVGRAQEVDAAPTTTTGRDHAPRRAPTPCATRSSWPSSSHAEQREARARPTIAPPKSLPQNGDAHHDDGDREQRRPRRARPRCVGTCHTSRPANSTAAAVSCENVMLPWPTKRMPMVGE